MKSDNRFRAIILAAGQGTRLRPLTDEIPKCMVAVGGRPIIEWQLEVLRDCGIDDISIVKGYRAGKLQYAGTREFINPQYDTTNMIYSLMCAAEALDGNVIISYGDIIYHKSVLASLMKAPGKIVVAADLEWRSYWQQRCENPLDDAETFQIGADGKVLSLGQKASRYEDVQAQYIGLIKCDARGAALMKEWYEDCRRDSAAAQNAWNSGRTLRKAYMTDLLNFAAQRGELTYLPIRRHWFEIDSPGDLAVANANLSTYFEKNNGAGGNKL